MRLCNLFILFVSIVLCSRNKKRTIRRSANSRSTYSHGKYGRGIVGNKSPPPPLLPAAIIVESKSMEEIYYAQFFGFGGSSIAMALSAIGAAYGTAKSGSAIASISSIRPEKVMGALTPIIMAGILSIYGLVISLFIALTCILIA